MKFSLKCVRSQGPRLGVISGAGRHGDKKFCTPMCLLYTRLGSVPNLSLEMLEKLHNQPEITQVPITGLIKYLESVKGFEQGIATFSTLKDRLVYCSIQDPATEVQSGYNDKSSVAVWGRGGKTKVDVELFMQFQSAMLSDWFQCLCDADTNKNSTAKRARKAVDRTLSFLDEIVEKKKDIKRLASSCLFGSVVGGWDERERLRSARETVARPVDGFVLEGFYNYGPKSETFQIGEVGDLFSKTLNLLPDEKPRVMHGVWGPVSVIKAVEAGIDIFDSSYPYTVTIGGEALVFNSSYLDTEQKEDDQDDQTGLTIKLTNKCYVDDFSPLVQGCKCYTCTKFTRAYINHLLNTSELLAGTLLMLHNNHHYYTFFNNLRSAIETDKLVQLKMLIEKQDLKTVQNSCQEQIF